MKIKEIKVKIGDLAKGFDISKYDGTSEDIMCFDGKLNVRPSYQRNMVYEPKRQIEVIKTVYKGYESNQQFPLNVMYWAKIADGTYQLLDGQQRTLSLLLYKNNQIEQMPMTGESAARKQWFDNYELTVYECSADDNETSERFEEEILEWFQTINIAGENLTPQELLNATYSGSWVSDAKKDFSNDKSMLLFSDRYNTQMYFKIDRKKLNRQEFLETVLKWKAQAEGLSIEAYMSKHRDDAHDTDLQKYFLDILEWIEATFKPYNKELLYGQDWGTLYNKYHDTFNKTSDQVSELMEKLDNDDEIEKKKGIVEYILSDDERYLSFREFDETVKERTYKLQNGICPMCVMHNELYPDKQVEIKHDKKDMQGDHIDAWSAGGKTVESNCCMLCKKHNGAKLAREVVWLRKYMDDLRKKAGD